MMRNLSIQCEVDAAVACTADSASTNCHSAGALAHTQLSYSPSMEKVNSEDAPARPPPPSTHTHTARRPAWQKKNGAKVMMRVKVWTRQLLQEVMTGTRNMLGKLVFSVSSHLLERCHLRLPGLDLVLLPVKVWMYGQSNRRPFLSRT